MTCFLFAFEDAKTRGDAFGAEFAESVGYELERVADGVLGRGVSHHGLLELTGQADWIEQNLASQAALEHGESAFKFFHGCAFAEEGFEIQTTGLE
jgi:hypothetical protein